MSNSYDDVTLSLAFNDGHNDAWNHKKPRPAPNGVLSDQKHQRYREGYEKGTTARYYYDRGYEKGKAESC